MATLSNKQTKTTSLTGQPQVQFQAQLLGLSENELQNSNGKNYLIAKIRFINPNGEEIRSSAHIYEGNYKYLFENVGKIVNGIVYTREMAVENMINNIYLATATKTDRGVYIQLSHLEQTPAFAGEDNFDFEEVSVDKVLPLEV